MAALSAARSTQKVSLGGRTRSETASHAGRGPYKKVLPLTPSSGRRSRRAAVDAVAEVSRSDGGPAPGDDARPLLLKVVDGTPAEQRPGEPGVGASGRRARPAECRRRVLVGN